MTSSGGQKYPYTASVSRVEFSVRWIWWIDGRWIYAAGAVRPGHFKLDRRVESVTSLARRVGMEIPPPRWRVGLE